MDTQQAGQNIATWHESNTHSHVFVCVVVQMIKQRGRQVLQSTTIQLDIDKTRRFGKQVGRQCGELMTSHLTK